MQEHNNTSQSILENLSSLVQGRVLIVLKHRRFGDNVDCLPDNQSESVYIRAGRDRSMGARRKDGNDRWRRESDIENGNSSSTDSEYQKGRLSNFGTYDWMEDFVDGIIGTMMSTKHRRYPKLREVKEEPK